MPEEKDYNDFIEAVATTNPLMAQGLQEVKPETGARRIASYCMAEIIVDAHGKEAVKYAGVEYQLR